MKRSHRGRPSGEDNRQLVAASLKSPVPALDNLTPLALLPGVKAAVQRHQSSVVPLGKALKALFSQAVKDVEESALGVNDKAMERVAIFLHVWYPDDGSVSQAARELHLTRGYVSSKIKPLAVRLVADRFLVIAGDLYDPGEMRNYSHYP